MTAKGGITKGKSHKEGGIPMVVKSTGQQVELEGGEGVINKRNMASEKTYEFEGEEKTICEIASEINSADGNGVQIDCDNITGTKYKYSDGGKVVVSSIQLENGLQTLNYISSYLTENGVPHFIDGQGQLITNDENYEIVRHYVNDFKSNSDTTKSEYEGGGVVFIPYNDQEIMYEPHDKKYYANDEEFDSLEDAQKYIDSGETPHHIREAYRRGLFKHGGGVRNLTLSDAVLYKDKTWYITNKNGVIGIANYSSGAWGSDYPFIPLSKINVDRELTDMGGRRIKISYGKGGRMKSQMDGSNMEDLHTATMSLGGYEEASAVATSEFKHGGRVNHFSDEVENYYDLENHPLVDSIEKEPNRSWNPLDEESNEYNYRLYLKEPYVFSADYKFWYGVTRPNKDELLSAFNEMLPIIHKKDMKNYRAEYKEGGEVDDDDFTEKWKSFKSSVADAFTKKPTSLNEATNVEMEHKGTINEFKRNDISTREVAKEIAKDHLKEDKDYYKKLDIVESKELGDILSEYDKLKNKRKNRKQFALGGSTDYTPHMVHLTFSENHAVDIYDNEGKYEGVSTFVKDKVYAFEFLNNRGTTTALQIPYTNKYIIVPNDIISIHGYDKKFAQGGNVPSPYKRYESILDENDIKILSLLRSSFNYTNDDESRMTIHQKELISTFKGVNVANQLSTEIISKMYSILFQDHNNELPINKLILWNVGVGNIVNLAPTYVEKISVVTDENIFEKIEQEICSIVNSYNYNKQWMFGMDESEYKYDAIMYVYPNTNPSDSSWFTSKVKELKNKSTGLAICEFSGDDAMNEFISNTNEIDGRTKYKFYKIQKGITENATRTLIFTLKREI